MSKFAEAMKGKLPDKPGTPPANTPPAAPATPPVNPPPANPPAPEPPKDAPKTPPAAPEPPKTPPQPDPDADIEAGKRSPKSEDFKRVKARAVTAETKAAEQERLATERQAEITRLTEALKTAGPSDYEEIKSQLTKFKTIAEAATLEVLPEFTAKYDGRRNNVVAGLKQAIGPKADTIIELLQLPDSESKRKRLGELMEDLDTLQQADIAAANRDLRQIEMDRKAELATAKGKLDEISTQRKEQAEKARAELTGVFSGRIKELQDKDNGIAPFQLRDKDDEWNKGVEARVKQAEDIFHGKFDNHKERAEAAIRAACAKMYLEQNISLTKKVADQEQIISRLQAAGPKITGDTPPTNTPAPRGGFATKVATGMRAASKAK